MIKNNKWFTLIELLVSMTIFSIIMISVFFVFFLASDLNNKTDISRSMQENVKNIVETIAEDVRKNWVLWIQTNNIWDNCGFSINDKFKKWTKLCTNLSNTYYLAKYDWINWIRIFNYTECDWYWESCVLVKNDWDSITPLSNSWVEFKDLYFRLSWDLKNPLLNVSFVLRPSFKKWVKINLIKDNTLNIQTTVAWRLYDY